MKCKICLLAILWPFLNAYAQKTKSQIPPDILQIGDTVPTQLWNLPLHVVNHPEGSTSITLKDYKKKLIILDFWATWCTPCIASLDKLNGLQPEFKDRVTVIPVTSQNKDVASSFFKKKNWNLPTVISDSIMTKIFPHQSIPHQVWIHDGVVLAITGPEYAIAKNIQAVLQGAHVPMNMKIEVDFDPAKPLLVGGNGGSENKLLYQSAITKRINARIGGFSQRDNRLSMYNVTLVALYQEAFNKAIPFQGRQNRVILEMNDSLRRAIRGPNIRLKGDYEQDKRLLNWAASNTYCYNIIFPRPLDRTRMYAAMQDDLNRFFGNYLGIEGRVEKRKVTCLALVRTGSKDRLRTTGESPLSEISSNHYRIRNIPFKSFIINLTSANWRSPYPIVDKTGYSGNVDIEIKSSLKNLEEVKKALEPYGLVLKKQELQLDMLVIRGISANF